jgi:hypothetical protein
VILVLRGETGRCGGNTLIIWAAELAEEEDHEADADVPTRDDDQTVAEVGREHARPPQGLHPNEFLELSPRRCAPRRRGTDRQANVVQRFARALGLLWEHLATKLFHNFAQVLAKLRHVLKMASVYSANECFQNPKGPQRRKDSVWADCGRDVNCWGGGGGEVLTRATWGGGGGGGIQVG